MLKYVTALWRSSSLTVCLSLALIMLSLYYGSVFELQSQVDSELKGVAARGERVRLADMEPPKIPVQSNAAPYYEAAIALNAFLDVPISDNIETSFTTHRAEVERSLPGLHSTFDLLASGYHKPDCAYRYRMEEGYRMLSPNYINIRNMAQTVALQSFLDIDQDHVDQAVANCTYELSFLSRFHHSDVLIEQMIKVACGAIAIQPMEKLADRGVRADYGDLLKEIDAAEQDNVGCLNRAIESERAMCLDVYNRLGDEPEILRDILGAENDRNASIIYRLGGRPLLLWDELRFLHIYDQFEQGLREHNPDLLEFKGTDSVPFKYLPSNLLLPNMRRAAQNVDKYQARLQALRARLESLNT